MPRPSRAQLFTEYQREPRRVRRAISRDFARANPIPPRSASGGIIGEQVRRRQQMTTRRADAIRLGSSGIPTSGQARVNAKRQQRAAFWAEHQRTVRIVVSAQVEPHFRQHLQLLGDRARIDNCTPRQQEHAFDLDVHIPGAPTAAVQAQPQVGYGLTNDGRPGPVLLGIEWTGADGRRIETPDLLAAV